MPPRGGGDGAEDAGTLRARSSRKEYAGRLVAALSSLKLDSSYTFCNGPGTWSATARAMGVEPYIGRTVWLMAKPGGSALYWHWQRPLRNPQGFPVARWFQPFCPATEHDQAAAIIAAAIRADVRRRNRPVPAELHR
jgi:hypothetical protein